MHEKNRKPVTASSQLKKQNIHVIIKEIETQGHPLLLPSTGYLIMRIPGQKNRVTKNVTPRHLTRSILKKEDKRWKLEDIFAI